MRRVLLALLLCSGAQAQPQRIISLVPSLTEMVCELQACDRLVGTDRFSNWPERVKSLPKLGGLEDAQIERIVALKPDLVLVASSARVIDRLQSLGLKVLALEPRSLQETQAVISTVAQALGDPAAGTRLWQRINQRIDAAAARVPPALRGKRVYFEVADSPYAAGEASFIGETLLRLGLNNIVPTSLGPFPKLNPEYVVRARPDIVMASARSLAGMFLRPGWGGLRGKPSCGFSAQQLDVIVRAGPRLGEAAEVMAQCLVDMK